MPVGRLGGVEGLVGAVDHGGSLRASRASFTTVGVPEARRLELWEDHNARALVAMTCRTFTYEALEASEWNAHTPGLRLARIAAGPHVVERTLREIQRNPAGAMLLTVVVSGEVSVFDSDGVVTLRPGHAVLTDADVPSMRGYAAGEQLLLTVPKPLYRDAVSAGTSPARRVFDLSARASGQATGSALVRLMREALEGTNPGDPLGLERDVLRLLGQMVLGPRAGDRDSQFEAASAFIRQNLTDPTLSASRVAAALGVSERQVSRIFSVHGGVARWITDERLDRARADLTASGRHSVGEVARLCGFGSRSHFARVFKQRYGISPRDVIDGGTCESWERAAG
jgi:AraC-like DNA-binding protein